MKEWELYSGIPMKMKTINKRGVDNKHAEIQLYDGRLKSNANMLVEHEWNDLQYGKGSSGM